MYTRKAQEQKAVQVYSACYSDRLRYRSYSSWQGGVGMVNNPANPLQREFHGSQAYIKTENIHSQVSNCKCPGRRRL
jgi:hypothetical protein